MELIRIRDILSAVNGHLLEGEEETFIHFVTTNSKEVKKGSLFVPIIGERVDGHRFIEGAMEKGAVAAFYSDDEFIQERTPGKAYIQVGNTLEALQQLAAYYRSLFSIPVIGVTGSVGKTTTKEMIAAALETRKKVLKTVGNMNSQVGLPLTILRLEKQHEIAVIEMGMSEKGEMEKLCQIAKPTTAVITNIGVSHIAQFGTKENIRREKTNIINEFSEGDSLYINEEDPLLYELKKYKDNIYKTKGEGYPFDQKTISRFSKVKLRTFGFGQGCLYHAEDIRTIGNETRFTYCYPEGREEIVLSVMGIHNVDNALAALAVASHCGIPPQIAKEGLKTYRPIAMRGQIYEKNGIKIVDDTYNASPDSMKSAINVLLSLGEVDRRVAVLGDIMELGEASFQCHYEIGEYIAKTSVRGNYIDELVTVGKEARAIVRGVKEKNPSIITHSFDRNRDVISYFKEHLSKNVALLVKGSRGMHTEEIVNAIIGNH